MTAWLEAWWAKAVVRRSLATGIGVLLLLPLLKGPSGFGFAPPSSGNFLALDVQNRNPVNVFLPPRLLTRVTDIYSFEIKWMLEVLDIRKLKITNAGTQSNIRLS